MGIIELAGVALAALLSENFIFVTCMGIGTRVQSFRDPVDALRTGYCLTAVMSRMGRPWKHLGQLRKPTSA